MILRQNDTDVTYRPEVQERENGDESVKTQIVRPKQRQNKNDAFV